MKTGAIQDGKNSLSFRKKQMISVSLNMKMLDCHYFQGKIWSLHIQDGIKYWPDMMSVCQWHTEWQLALWTAFPLLLTWAWQLSVGCDKLSYSAKFYTFIHFIQQISSTHPQMTYVYAKNGHKKPAEKFRDLCSAGTLYMQFWNCRSSIVISLC